MDLKDKINDFQELAFKYMIDAHGLNMTDDFREKIFKQSFRVFIPAKIYLSLEDFKKDMSVFAMRIEIGVNRQERFESSDLYQNRQLQKIVFIKIINTDVFKKFVNSSFNLLRSV